MAVLVRLLGEVSAEVDGGAVDLGSPRQRCVLAALAVDAGRVVPVDRLVERVWGVDARPQARATLHSYISRLRRALAGVAIVRRSGGYALTTDTTEPVVDVHRFRDLRAAADADADDEQTARLLADALRLWRGQALTGVDSEWAQAERDRLRLERLAAQHDLTEARLRLGLGADLVVELAARSAEHPLDEHVAGHYMLALHQAGRTADALGHYQRLRERLVEELGTDPGVALHDLHRRILAADPALSTTTVWMGTPSVDVLSEREALDLLTTRLGMTRSAPEADAVGELIAWCGGIPLALSNVASRAEAFPGEPLTRLAHHVRGGASRIGVLDEWLCSRMLTAVVRETRRRHDRRTSRVRES